MWLFWIVYEDIVYKNFVIFVGVWVNLFYSVFDKCVDLVIDFCVIDIVFYFDVFWGFFRIVVFLIGVMDWGWRSW